MSRCRIALIACTLWLGSGSMFALPARAEQGASAASPTCPDDASPHVDGAISTAAGDEALARQIEAHLRAALLARGIAFCLRPSNPDRSASLAIEVEPREGRGPAVRISIEDVLTQKRVERQVDLSSLPEDSWALSIAASSDELLRASWAELVMRDAPAAAPAAPEAALSRAAAAVRPVRERNLELVPEAVALLYAKRTAFGGGLRASYRLRPRWWLGGSLAAAFGLRQSSTHGSVATDSVEISLHAGFVPTPLHWPVGVRLELAPALSRLSFGARANASGEASSSTAWSVSALARVRTCFARGALRLCASLGALWAINPQRARDVDRVVASNEGAGGEASLGLGAAF